MWRLLRHELLRRAACNDGSAHQPMALYEDAPHTSLTGSTESRYCCSI
jgi:hypothetical protein